MADEAITLDPGQIQFYDFARPPLTAGKRTVVMRQEVNLASISSDPSSVTFSQQQDFFVEGPRFGLLPKDVQTVYPPANHSGTFLSDLPHIVLRRRTLPWEVTAFSVPAGSSPRPWLALLLFHEGEPVTESTVPLSQLTGQSVGPGILGPAVTLSPQLFPQPETVRTQVIDISADLFRAVMPTVADLPFLAHVRQVNTGGKEMLGLEADGWFSVVLCNRLPGVGLNRAYLISLEGWASRLAPENGAPSLPSAITTCRLVSLAQWSFTATPDPGSFGAWLTRATPGTLSFEAAETAAGDVRVAQALNVGFVPLAHHQRSGERGTAWYHGPLAPVNWEFLERLPFPNAEAAMIYDPASGMFDVSYGVAWQIGRLLALSDGPFAKTLNAWRQQAQQFEDKLLELQSLREDLRQEKLFERLAAIERMSDSEARKKALLEFLDALDDPQAAYAVAAGAFLQAAVKADLISAPDAAARLSEGAIHTSSEDLRKLLDTPLGPKRVAELRRLIFSQSGGPA